jgi:fatty-acid desaturase
MHNEVITAKNTQGINWHSAIFLGLFHIGAVAALLVFSWQALLSAIVIWWISASLGVGMGFHRLLTHRG